MRTVDGLRGLAALLVVFDHTVDDSWGLGGWTQQNHGITVFALLTGFLLSGRFLKARVYPGYWVALAVAAATIGLNAVAGPGDVWRVVTLTQAYGEGTPLKGLPPTWSLSLFMSFYLALPLWSWWRGRADRRAGRTAGPLLRREVAWLSGLVLLAFAVRATSATDPIAHSPSFTLFGRADWFAAGMLVAVLVAAQARGLAPRLALLPGRRPGMALAAALALSGSGALVALGLPWEARNQLDTAAAVLLVGAMVLHGPTLVGPQRLLASRPARALGRWSYGIFLWGYICEEALRALAPGIPTAPLLALTIASATALGAASWRWIEHPTSHHLRTLSLPRPRLPRPSSAAAIAPILNLPSRMKRLAIASTQPQADRTG